MAWTYDLSDLNSGSTSANRTKVRLIIGDTSTGDQLLANEEIDCFLAQGGVRTAAIESAKAIAAKFARDVESKKVGDLQLTKMRWKQYLDLAKSLKEQQVGAALPIVGAISRDDKDARERDTDRPDPAFFRGQFDHLGVGQDGGGVRASTGGILP